MHLQQLKSQLVDKADMSGVYEQIKDDAQDGDDVAVFSSLNKFQISHLEDNGYEVRWDRACQRFEVSGW